MKRLLLTVVALVALLAVDAKPKQGAEAEIKVGTYNVWGNKQRRSMVYKYKTAPTDRLWEHSRENVAQMIVDADWDIFGVQEGGSLVREELPKLVKKRGGKYKWWFQRPNPAIPESEDTNLANGMVWRSDRFKVSNKQVYWLSPTPDTPSKAWEEKVKHWRFVMSATVKDKKTGLEFIFMVTHCPLMKSVNEKAAKLIVEREKMMNPEDRTVIFVGDMNSRLDSPYTNIIRTRFTDTRDIAKQKSDVSGTMNGAEVRETPKDYTIDYIYIRGSKLKYEVLRHDVLVDKYKVNGKEYFPSDHCPVSAVVKLKNN